MYIGKVSFPLWKNDRPEADTCYARTPGFPGGFMAAWLEVPQFQSASSDLPLLLSDQTEQDLLPSVMTESRAGKASPAEISHVPTACPQRVSLARCGVPSYDPSHQEAEAGGYQDQGLPELHNETTSHKGRRGLGRLSSR